MMPELPTRELAGGSGVSGLNGVALAGMEPLFEPIQVAEYLQLDVTTVRRLFLDRADVVKIGRTVARGGRRSYTTLRIPLSALRAFLRERSK
jgi:hypothetical protein